MESADASAKSKVWLVANLVFLLLFIAYLFAFRGSDDLISGAPAAMAAVLFLSLSAEYIYSDRVPMRFGPAATSTTNPYFFWLIVTLQVIVAVRCALLVL